MSVERLNDLKAQARYARERYQLYKAKSFGQRLTSPARLRELQRTYEQAEARLSAATTEEQRAPAAQAGQQDPSPKLPTPV
jgi:hypothetical protein